MLAFHESGEYLWTAGSFSLAAVLGGHLPCPPAVRYLVFVAWRPPESPRMPPARTVPSTPRAPLDHPGRRASDRVTDRPGAREEEATLRAAWELALEALSPVAAKRIGAGDLAFVTTDDATDPCRELLESLRKRHPLGDWRVGFTCLEGVGIIQAARSLELWILDDRGPGSWLMDATGLAHF